MIKREANFTLLFRHWIKKHPQMSGAYELKQSQTESIPFSVLKEHQEDALLAAKSNSGLLYKAPDDSRGIKPFDLFYLRNCRACVVIKYPKTFEIIDIETWVLEKSKSTRKSLTSARAREISTITVVL